MSFSLTKKIILILVVIYVTAGIILFLLQENILFHPQSLPADHKYSFQQPFQEINVDRGARNLNIIRFETFTMKKGVVLYLHGNRDNIGRYAHMASLFTDLGFVVWMIDYPGFGKSTGNISEEILYEDAAFMYDLAKKEYPSAQIVIYGRSIGSGIAAQLASTKPSHRLILETPYYSMSSLANNYAPMYPVKKLLRYKFPTNEYISGLSIPITIFHGTKDELIPYSQAEKLKKGKPSATLIPVEGGKHNDLYKHTSYLNALRDILHPPASLSDTPPSDTTN